MVLWRVSTDVSDWEESRGTQLSRMHLWSSLYLPPSLSLSIEKCDKLPYTPAAAWLVVLLSAQKLPPVYIEQRGEVLAMRDSLTLFHVSPTHLGQFRVLFLSLQLRLEVRHGPLELRLLEREMKALRKPEHSRQTH